ncbi:hypothetical protein ABPG72_005913 [Tetrahymena utriculariae]
MEEISPPTDFNDADDGDSEDELITYSKLNEKQLRMVLKMFVRQEENSKDDIYDLDAQEQYKKNLNYILFRFLQELDLQPTPECKFSKTKMKIDKDFFFKNHIFWILRFNNQDSLFLLNSFAGQDGCLVEIDESFFRRKHHRDRMLRKEQQQLFELNEHRNDFKRTLLFLVKKRNAETLVPIIRQSVSTNQLQIVFSNQRRTYSSLKNYGFCHKTIKHKLHIVVLKNQKKIKKMLTGKEENNRKNIKYFKVKQYILKPSKTDARKFQVLFQNQIRRSYYKKQDFTKRSVFIRYFLLKQMADTPENTFKNEIQIKETKSQISWVCRRPASSFIIPSEHSMNADLLIDIFQFNFRYSMGKIMGLEPSHIAKSFEVLKLMFAQREQRWEKKKQQKSQIAYHAQKQQLKKTRRAHKGTPQSSTTFNRKNRTPSNKRKGQSRSTSSQKSSQSSLRWRSLNNSWQSSSNKSKKSYKSFSSREDRARLHTQTCRFWNQSKCQKGENCEYAHFHLKFFHKTQNLQTKGKAQLINQTYQQQIKEGKVLVEVKQLKFLQWSQVEEFAKNLTSGVYEQAISIATQNKNAERDYKKELNKLKQQDDDSMQRLDQKIAAFKKYYDQLIKFDIKNDAAKNQVSNKMSKKQQSQQKLEKSNQQNSQEKNMEVQYNYHQSNEINQQQRKEYKPTQTNPIIDQKQDIKSTEELTQKQNEMKPILKNKKASDSKEIIKQKQQVQQLTENPSQQDEIQKIGEQLYKPLSKQLDPKYLNDLAVKSSQKSTFPEDSQHCLISKQIELNQAWDNKLIQMITDHQYFIEELYQASKIKSRNLRNKIKYALFINAYILQLIKSNFKNFKFDIIETAYHNICIIALTPIIKILKKDNIIQENDQIQTQGLIELLFGEQTQTKNVIQINTDQNKPVLTIVNLNLDGINKFQ